jgi:hypothetical protein
VIDLAASKELVKPLVSGGGKYLAEVAKCVGLGVLAGAAVLSVLLALLPSGRGLGLVAFGGCLLFVLAYGLAGHQRGIFGVLSGMAHTHGGLLYDQTLGRFVASAEARQPGTLAGLLSAPGRLTASFDTFLRHEGSILPGLLRRVGRHYVAKIDRQLTAAGSLPAEAVVGGQLHERGLRAWAVERMREQFEPTWRALQVIAALQALAAFALWWFTRG